MNGATIESRLATGASAAGTSVRRADTALLCVSLLLAAALAASSGAGFGRIAVLIVLAPLAEEAVFRAGLQEALLRRHSALIANGLTALAFGLVHVLARGDASAFAVAGPALLLGAVYGRWRRVRLCAALHAAMNAVWLAWAAVGPTTPLGL